MARQRFLDLMGATNLIPGPNSTEMTMHLGYERSGAAGLVAAGTGFILPAAGITAALAWLYVEFGVLPAVESVLAGVRPAVLVIILAAVWKLGRRAIPDWRLAAIATAVAAAVAGGIGEVPAILLGGLAGGLFLQLPRVFNALAASWFALGLGPGAASAASEASLPKLGLFFLKVGSVLYGSGYVLVAFLEGGLVDSYGWLTRQQLLDAIAVGQFTPGPVLTTATFVGFLVGGLPGAAVATAGIFLPAFGFTWILNPLVAKLRASAWTAAFLDAINASAVGLMAVVAIDLGQATLYSWPAWIIAVVAAALLFLARWPAMRVVAVAVAAGWVASAGGWQ